MRSAMQSDKKGLTARDLVTCGVFIALYFVFMMVGSMLFAPNPVLTFLMPAGAALLTGPIYLLLVAKVPKHGPIIILGVVEGLIMFVTGMYWLWAVALVVLGVVADLIAGAGRFRNKNLNLVSFLVFSLNPMGSYLMLWIDPSGYTSYLAGKGTEQAYLDTMVSTGAGAAGHDRADAGVRPGERAGGSPSAEEAVREGGRHRMIDRAFRPDPRAKLALLLLWAVAVFLSPGLWFEALLMLLSVALGIALGKGRLALGMLGLYAVMMACMLATAQLDTGVLKTMLSSFFMLVRKVFPCGLLAAVIVSTTHVNEFMSAFSRMRVPRQVTIPLAVMLRYVPAIREDWRFISDAMRMRGVNASLAGFLRRPGMTVECLYVPLMMSASNVADELSMASVARGIENPAQRTCYTHIEFRASDGLLVAAGVAVVVAALACSLLGVGK